MVKFSTSDGKRVSIAARQVIAVEPTRGIPKEDGGEIECAVVICQGLVRYTVRGSWEIVTDRIDLRL